MSAAGGVARRIRRFVRPPIEEGDWVHLAKDVTLTGAGPIPAGTYVRVVGIDADGRYLVEVPGFAGDGETAAMGKLGRVQVDRDGLRPGWFPTWWRQRPL